MVGLHLINLLLQTATQSVEFYFCILLQDLKHQTYTCSPHLSFQFHLLFTHTIKLYAYKYINDQFFGGVYHPARYRTSIRSMGDNQPSGMVDVRINFVRHMTPNSLDVTGQNPVRSTTASRLDGSEEHQ